MGVKKIEQVGAFDKFDRLVLGEVERCWPVAAGCDEDSLLFSPFWKSSRKRSRTAEYADGVLYRFAWITPRLPPKMVWVL